MAVLNRTSMNIMMTKCVYHNTHTGLLLITPLARQSWLHTSPLQLIAYHHKLKMYKYV